MKTLKFNEEEIDLLVALYEDELKEAGSYMDKLKQTLAKLKKQAVTTELEPVSTGKKRGRKPKIHSEEPMPIIVEKKKRGRKPKIPFEESKLIFGKKRGRKPKILQEYTPLVTMVENTSSPRKRKARKTKKHASLKIKAEKLPKVEMPVTEEIKP
jgi:hypothetical protein